MKKQFITFRRIFITLFFSWSMSSLSVYSEPLKFVNYEIEDGLSSNTVRAICQDHKGFIWVATLNGLNRFDGETFRIFRKIGTDPGALGSNYVLSLFEDSQNLLWVGTEHGVYIYEHAFERFSFFSLNTVDGFSISSTVIHITEDTSGILWFSTDSQGLFAYNPEIGVLKRYVPREAGTTDIFPERIYYTYVDSEGVIWCTTSKNRGLFQYNPEKDCFEEFRLKSESLSSFTIHWVIEDAFHSYWLGTWNNGILKMNKYTGEVESYLSPEQNGVSHIHSMLNYKPGFLLVGSDDGLVLFNTITYESDIMKTSEFDPHSISNNFIYPIYKDREGGIWIGTYYGGVNYSAPNSIDIRGYSHSEYQNSVSGQIISCFCEDDEGNVWIGSDDGGLSCFDPKLNQFTHYKPESGKNSLSYHNVHAVLPDENYLWIGTYSGGLNRMDMKSKKFSYYLTETSGGKAGNNSIYSLFKDEQETLWVGTMTDIMTYDPGADTFFNRKSVGTTTIAMVQDQTRYIWFATLEKGILRYNPQNEKWDHFINDPQRPGSLPCDQVNCLYVDDGNYLWIGTDEGLCRYDPVTGEFELVPFTNNYVSIYKIIGERDDLWITTNRGLYKYQVSRELISHYSRRDGLQSEQFNTNAGLLARNGLIYLGTVNGFNILNPRSVYMNNFIPPVVFTNLQVFNKNVEVREGKILKESITDTDELELTYKENVFSLEFAALSYSIPSKNQYRYMLEGFDKDWNYIENQKKATYTNLPAGKYVFKVHGTNNDGIWNEQGARLQIRIMPPFWKTNWAYCGYIVILFGVIGLLILKARIKVERKHKTSLRRLEEQKEKELHQAKINFFTMIAHEIRTPVSLVIGPLEKIMDNMLSLPENVREDLKIMNRNSQRLLSLVNQLLDFRKAEEGGFSMSFASVNMYDLLENLYVRFKPLANQKDINLKFVFEDQKLEVVIDAEAVTKIVSNLLTNAVKYAKDRIELVAIVKDQNFIIRVKDNGPGIVKAEVEEIFNPFYQSAIKKKPGTGLGLYLAKSLVEAHHGFIKVESEKDLFTEFCVTLPLRQNEELLIQSRIKQNDLMVVDCPVDIIQDASPEFPVQENKDLKNISTILIVEDNIELKSFLSSCFASSYHILLAENGKEGLKQLSEYAVDIIVSDIMMPVMDGLTFCKEIKNDIRYSHIPFILLTAKTDNASRLEGIRNGADAYLEKPFSPQILEAMIENLVKGRDCMRRKFSEMPFTPLNSIAANKADKEFLDRMNEVITENISNEEFSIEMLALEMGVSRSGIFIKIKQLLDMTPNELIQVIRLKKAAELLLTKEYRINEICYQVGFSSPSYFSKCFQKQFGMLPRDFMNKQK